MTARPEKIKRKWPKFLLALVLVAGFAIGGENLSYASGAGSGSGKSNPGTGSGIPPGNPPVDFGCAGRGASNPGCGSGSGTDIDPETPSKPPDPPSCERGGTNKSAMDYPDHYNTMLDLLRDNWIGALMMMTEQFTVNMMQQALIIGTFLDAKHQQETMLLFRDLQTQAHENYHSSFQMCRFGTNVKSLAASDITAQRNAQMMHKILSDRDRLAANSSSSAGFLQDYGARVAQFGKTYCNIMENNGEIDPMCRNFDATNKNRISADIDFPRLIDQKQTIDIDFTDTITPGDEEELKTEEDIIALSKNLFGTPTFSFVSKQVIEIPRGRDAFLQLRSVQAVRSVATHSFASIVGMKAKGHKEVAPYLKRIIQELGMPDDEIEEFVGKNPSYFVQMEILTKRMYQNPVFYTNLYDKPENVRRAGVSMLAIRLMHDRDRYESALRRELMVSLILEMKLRAYQDEMEKRIVAAGHTSASDN